MTIMSRLGSWRSMSTWQKLNDGDISDRHTTDAHNTYFLHVSSSSFSSRMMHGSFCSIFLTRAQRLKRRTFLIIIIIIRQPLCPVVGRRPQQLVSKLPCLVLSSAISCCSSICPGRLSTAWLVCLDVCSCHMVSNW